MSAHDSTAFPRNDIEVALVEAQRGDLGIEDWLRRLGSEPVHVPTTPGAGSGSAGLPVLSIAGRSYVPIFTSLGEARLAAPSADLLAPTLVDLVGTLPGGVGVSINPGRPISLAVPPEDLRRILGGERTLGVGSRIRVGDPVEEPTAVLRAVANGLSGLPAVREVRRAWVAIDDDPPGLVLGIDIDPDSPEVRRVVTEAVRSAAPPVDYSIDVAFSNDGGPIVEWMWASGQPVAAGD